jgi:hypothetical protein
METRVFIVIGLYLTAAAILVAYAVHHGYVTISF